MENNELYNIFDGFKSKTEAYKFFGFCGNNVGIIRLNNMANSIGFNLDIYGIRRKPPKKYCKTCNNELKNKQRDFCSHSCSATFSNKHRIMSFNTKEKIKNTLTKNIKKIRKCKICGQEICANNEICNHTQNWFDSLSPFGFNINTFGTIDIYREYYRIKDLLLKEYLDNNLSPKDIAIKYNYNKNSENILHVLKSFGVKTRNLSESEVNACQCGKLNNKIKNQNTRYQFKHGWHKTWNNKEIYYRSSYELEFAKKLDEYEIEYESEYFRIKYWDTQKFKYRIAIPDFYIPQENKIIEIKSRVTFNKQNIIDKFNEYIKMGFNVILILENIEYSFNDLNGIKQNTYLIGK